MELLVVQFYASRELHDIPEATGNMATNVHESQCCNLNLLMKEDLRVKIMTSSLHFIVKLQSRR